ncbi:MAG TPA: cyclopropane-fatty-acyl-phospholipid synthase family protein [Anaeromyxobacteraceae bacterium]|nr:cyclopropane-fatty-acyl-phospholipid synthase family protein [Anaeromyxobacteraceae bacterium]
MDLLRAAGEMFSSPSRMFSVRLWDGTLLPSPHRGAPGGACVALTSPEGLAAFVPPSSERRVAEAFLDGAIELEGDAVGLLEAASRWAGPRFVLSTLPVLAGALASRTGRISNGRGARLAGRVHSVSRDGAAVRYHYDLSNDFYRLFLDRSMVYSCAYFPSGHESIEEAQQQKLALICRKLALRPGDRFLDVGCGWGALLEHAVAHHGVEAVGVTPSAHQLAEVERRAARLTAGAHLTVLPVDYRTLPDGAPFDKIASVGMMEHVGRDRLDGYFAALFRALRPGGLFLNHAIADISRGTTLPWARRRRGGFIARYIFPDSDLVPLPRVVAAAERAGFEVRDVESLREHYTETLQVWLRRLESRFREAVAVVGPRRARAYRLYLAASAVAFRVGTISVFQLLLAKRNAAGRALGVPRSRKAWYEADSTLPRRGTAWT